MLDRKYFVLGTVSQLRGGNSTSDASRANKLTTQKSVNSNMRHDSTSTKATWNVCCTLQNSQNRSRQVAMAPIIFMWAPKRYRRYYYKPSKGKYKNKFSSIPFHLFSLAVFFFFSFHVSVLSALSVLLSLNAKPIHSIDLPQLFSFPFLSSILPQFFCR
jgi:hypothetical protein